MSESITELITEQLHPGSSRLDEMAIDDLLDLMNSADAEVPAAVSRQIPQIGRAVEAIAGALERGGHLVYIGAGTSGRLGVLDASECPPTFGVSPDLIRGIMAGGEAALARASETSEDDPAAGVRDLIASGFGKNDALFGIAASGRTPYVLGAVAKAHEMGGLTCGLSCNPDTELSRAVDFPIEVVVGPEILTGSTRLRAGTATKLVLNMISTAVMIRLGHVYGNLMVNVAPKNRKLEDRARRIIEKITGANHQRAGDLLEQSGGSVRVAIVMERRGVDRAQAEKLLAAARGRISGALKQLG